MAQASELPKSTLRMASDGRDTAPGRVSLAEAPPDTPGQLRGALRRMAKAVVVVTCRLAERRFAMAATAVSELSMAPPSLLVCVNKSASIWEPLSRVEHFGISILHRAQRSIAENCSGAMKGEARFGMGSWGESPDGVPYLLDAQAYIFCRNERRVDYGTHGIFIGQVLAAHTTGEVSPLVYLDGQYTGASG